jgi:hypothetical protein
MRSEDEDVLIILAIYSGSSNNDRGHYSLTLEKPFIMGKLTGHYLLTLEKPRYQHINT